MLSTMAQPFGLCLGFAAWLEVSHACRSLRTGSALLKDRLPSSCEASTSALGGAPVTTWPADPCLCSCTSW